MSNMTQRKPDSATPTGEPASAVRSPRHDLDGNCSLCSRPRAGSTGQRPRAEPKRERAQMPWLGRRGGWGQKGWRCGRGKQGDPSGPERCSWPVSPKSLLAAFWAVWRNDGAPGVDDQTVKQFDEHAVTELARLSEELRTKRYRRQPARRVWIPKPGTSEKRPLGIPAVRDRTVEAATRNV